MSNNLSIYDVYSIVRNLSYQISTLIFLENEAFRERIYLENNNRYNNYSRSNRDIKNDRIFLCKSTNPENFRENIVTVADFRNFKTLPVVTLSKYNDVYEIIINRICLICDSQYVEYERRNTLVEVNIDKIEVLFSLKKNMLNFGDKTQKILLTSDYWRLKMRTHDDGTLFANFEKNVIKIIMFEFMMELVCCFDLFKDDNIKDNIEFREKLKEFVENSRLQDSYYRSDEIFSRIESYLFHFLKARKREDQLISKVKL